VSATPFDVTGPLPRGVTVLEASAGTGKTYTIAALAARYVAAGIPLEQVLLVTFTRMATGELRERVRERLLSTEQGLRHALRGDAPAGDPVVELLARGPEAEVDLRWRRCRRALSDFDAATIATTHGFCQEVLGGLGLAADLEPEVEFVEDLSDLVGEVLDDLYVRRFRQEQALFGRRQALAIARIAVENPEALVVPAAGELGAMRVRLAKAVRLELEARKRRLAVMSYGDLLTRLAGALAGDEGPAIAERLRQAYRVVLVDEFQDTDPVQWDIVRRAFGHAGGALVLIADPKQAIYAFRGADVYAYLQAASAATTHATLGVNWRSDQGLLDAYDALFGNARLGHEGIAYRRVQAAPAGRSPRMRGAPCAMPLRIRVVDREAVGTTPSGYARTDAAREHVARDLAADLVALLGSGAQVRARSEDPWEDVCPEDVAVLVPRNDHAALIQEALAQAGVPAVTGGAGSVFATPSAQHWLALLEALERPASVSRAHTVALTPVLGWSPGRIAAATEGEWGTVHRALHEWAGLLRDGGVAALLETIARATRLQERTLARLDGERRLTDLRHIARLLHAAAHEEQLGAAALSAWLRRRIAQADRDSGDEERSRRLDSDAQAVQVLTIHRSKGLEFPIVLLPFLWDMGRERKGQPVCFHDPDAAYARRIDVAMEGPDFARHHRQSVIEERGEDLRLAYVALTRARHQAVLWWAGAFNSRHAPLTRLMFARGADGTVAPYGNTVPDDKTATARFRTLAELAPERVAIESADLGLPATWRPPLRPPAELEVARFTRTLDARWRRTSYSAMTASAHATAAPERVGSEPEMAVLADEPDLPPTSGLTTAAAAAVDDLASDPARSQPGIPSLLTALPAGVAAGTLVHQVLEATDFAAADLAAELGSALESAQARRSVELGDRSPVVAGLQAAIETPLGPVVGDIRLRDIAAGDRLDELEFELPLAGGDRPRGAVTPALIGRVLSEHLAAADPLRGYAVLLAGGELAGSVRGYLTGFLDLVVRLPGDRFAVIDYKTNWLASPETPLTSWHYRPEALVVEMRRRHYGLQALLYTVALHRFLRWRLPGYDPERNLAGVVYAFLRGMTGAGAQVTHASPSGVFGWRAPAAAVRALSDALEQGGGS